MKKAPLDKRKLLFTKRLIWDEDNVSVAVSQFLVAQTATPAKHSLSLSHQSVSQFLDQHLFCCITHHFWVRICWGFCAFLDQMFRVLRSHDFLSFTTLSVIVRLFHAHFKRFQTLVKRTTPPKFLLNRFVLSMFEMFAKNFLPVRAHVLMNTMVTNSTKKCPAISVQNKRRWIRRFLFFFLENEKWQSLSVFFQHHSTNIGLQQNRPFYERNAFENLECWQLMTSHRAVATFHGEVQFQICQTTD